MKTNVKRRIAYVILFAILIISIFFLLIGTSLKEVVSGHELPVGEEELPPVQESDPVALSVDKADSPIAGRTSWANETRPLGLVIYLNDVSFTENQTQLQARITPESLNKITFTRGDKSATPTLICASKDGSYGSKSFFAFFFAGELAAENVNEYQVGDTFEIAEGCILKCNEGSFYFDGAIKYIYDGEEWVTELIDPVALSVDKADSPIAGRTSWANETRPLGLVIYLNDVSFTENQTQLQARITPESLNKITFTRGDKSATPTLICASKDGSYGSKSYFAFFFAGELVNETVNEYQVGDTFEIAEGCILKCNEGSFYFDGAIKYIYDGEEWVTELIDPVALSVDKADSPVAGRTSWANETRPLGLVIYLNDVSFTENQTQLQARITPESLNKITFTRGDKSATPTLICASKDGSYGSKSYFAFFFAGELAAETVNEYQVGDTFEIAEGCILKCNEGSFYFDGAIKYIYDGKQWTAEEETDPESIEYSITGVPVDGVTNWGKDKGYVGIVLYNDGWTFEGGQTHLEVKPWTKTEKVTFTRGDITEECVLIAAGLDGNKDLCYCSYFFGGELTETALQIYDTVKIKGDFAFTTKEGRYSYGKDLEFFFDGEQWTAEEEIEPKIIDYSTTGVPVDGVTNWGKDKKYVGIVLYNKGWTFEGDQANLEVKPWTKTEKVTFIRGNITEECVLIAAGLDGNKNLCYCSYFFGGELTGTALQLYDTVKIKGDFAFTTKEGRYSYGKDLELIFDGEQWLDTAIGDGKETDITYITEPKDDGDRILFNLKTTTIFGVYDLVTDSLKQSILINGVSVSDLGIKAEINYSFSKIVLSVDKSALKLDDYDMIVIKKGAILKGDEDTGLKLRDDETFRYSYTLKRTDFIPDHEYYGNLSNYAIIDNIEVSGDVASTINGVKYNLSHSVWIHFKWAAKFNYDNLPMHISAEQSVLNGINEELCYEYQKLGLFYSVTDLLKVNGKSLYEWMITDAKNGKPNCFKVEYLPYEIDTGRVLRIVVADESALDIGVGFDQTIEFKQGFINPGLGEIQKDSLYSIKKENAETNKKFDMGSGQESGSDNGNTDLDNNNADQKKSGCGGEICVEHSLFFLAIAMLGSFILLGRKSRKENK